MARILGQTPSWLCPPSAGSRIFSDPEAALPASPNKRSNLRSTQALERNGRSTRKLGRLIAHRGTEIFTVVGNKIRWADLSKVKQDAGKQNAGDSTTGVYRTLKTSVYYEITNLAVSPSGHFLAISTEHTVHVAILPDGSRLRDNDYSDIKLKIYQVGPTVHVIPEAPLAAVLWHPLAVATASTDCLVTVTHESAVRLWELNRAAQWSFEKPALAIDLRKLANGTSSDQDFEPLGFGKNRGFSADTADMDAATATFGGVGADTEDPWAAMTLWTAMNNGDCYALCPLLPSSWTTRPMTIGALTTSAVSAFASMGDDTDEDEKNAIHQRYEWVRELDEIDDSAGDSLRHRPECLGAIPRLQGPFELPVADVDDEVETCDMVVFPACLDEDGLFSSEDDYEIISDSKLLPFTVVCLSDNNNQIYVMMELEGVTGQWLPGKERSSFSVATWDMGEFILLDMIKLSGNDNGTPTKFTPSLVDPYSLYITSFQGIQNVSLKQWIARVGSDLNAHEDLDTGLGARLKLACQQPICVIDELLAIEHATPLISTTVVINGESIGTLLLSASNATAVAVQLEEPDNAALAVSTNAYTFSPSQSSFRESRSLAVILSPAFGDGVTESHSRLAASRSPYIPSRFLYTDQREPFDRLRGFLPPNRRHLLKESPLRLSPACLEVMTAVHKSVSVQTGQIEKAASEIFRKTDLLRIELQDQIEQMSALAERLNMLTNAVDFDTEKAGLTKEDLKGNRKEQVDKRVEHAQLRQQALVKRYEAIRQKISRAGQAQRELSTKEKSWVNEIDTLAIRVGLSSNGDVEDGTENDTGTDTLVARWQTTQPLANELISESKKLAESDEKQSKPPGDAGGPHDVVNGHERPRSSLGTHLRVSSRFQRQKLEEVMGMVERESAIIDATTDRLSRLQV